MLEAERLKEYASYVRSMAIREDGEIFQNSGHDHARIVINELLSNAKERVDVLAGTLNAGSYTEELVNRLMLRLKDSQKIRVVLEAEHQNDRELSAAVVSLRKFGVEVRVIMTQLANHFCVVDEKSFRFEEDTSESKAFFGFGQRQMSERLSSHFDTVWNAAVPLDKYLTERTVHS